MKGSACRGCMKMCPWNREIRLRLGGLSNFQSISPSRSAHHRKRRRRRQRQPQFDKALWFDLEVIDGVARLPRPERMNAIFQPRPGRQTGRPTEARNVPTQITAPTRHNAKGSRPCRSMAGMDEYLRRRRPRTRADGFQQARLATALE